MVSVFVCGHQGASFPPVAFAGTPALRVPGPAGRRPHEAQPLRHRLIAASLVALDP